MWDRGAGFVPAPDIGAKSFVADRCDETASGLTGAIQDLRDRAGRHNHFAVNGQISLSEGKRSRTAHDSASRLYQSVRRHCTEESNINLDRYARSAGYSQSFGTANCSRAVANKRIDRASPLLISRAAANQLIPSVIVTMRKAGERQSDFFIATLGQVLVDRIEVADQDGQLVKRVVLAPQAITIQYFPLDSKGLPLPPVVSSVACTPSRR
jgi:type VI protein secretion system component Hcp